MEVCLYGVVSGWFFGVVNEWEALQQIRDGVRIGGLEVVWKMAVDVIRG